MPYKDPVKQRAYLTAYQRSWRLANYEKVLAKDEAYRRAHPELRRARCRAWHATHRKERKAYDAARYAAHRDERKAKDAVRHAAHPEWGQVAHARRAAKRKDRPATLTAKEWDSIKAAYKHCCAYCGKQFQRLTQDHVIPLSKGGGTTRENIVPACKSCNSKKSTNSPIKPIKLVLL